MTLDYVYDLIDAADKEGLPVLVVLGFDERGQGFSCSAANLEKVSRNGYDSVRDAVKHVCAITVDEYFDENETEEDEGSEDSGS